VGTYPPLQILTNNATLTTCCQIFLIDPQYPCLKQQHQKQSFFPSSLLHLRNGKDCINSSFLQHKHFGIIRFWVMIWTLVWKMHLLTLWPSPLTFNLKTIPRSFPIPSLSTLGSFVFELCSGQTNKQINRRTQPSTSTCASRLYYHRQVNNKSSVTKVRAMTTKTITTHTHTHMHARTHAHTHTHTHTHMLV